MLQPQVQLPKDLQVRYLHVQHHVFQKHCSWIKQIVGDDP